MYPGTDGRLNKAYLLPKTKLKAMDKKIKLFIFVLDNFISQKII